MVQEIEAQPANQAVDRTGGQTPSNGQAPWRLNLADQVPPPAKQLPPVDKPFDPNLNTNKTSTGQPWRLNYSENVAPAAGGPNGNGLAPWRVGDPVPAPVAPGQGGRPGDKPPAGTPVVGGGGNGLPPWRAEPGVAPIVPGAGGRPGGGGDQTPPWSSTVALDTTSRVQMPEAQPIQPQNWSDRVRAEYGGNMPSILRPNATVGNPIIAVSDEQRAIIERSGRLQNSVTSLLYQGGFAGATVHAGTYLMDAKLLATPIEQRTGLIKWWEQFSPAHRGLQAEVAAYQAANNTAIQLAGRQQLAATALQAVETTVPTMVSGLEGRLATLATGATDAALISRQLEFLRTGAAGVPDSLKAAIGTADEVAAGSKLFVTGSTEATNLMRHAELRLAHQEAVSAAANASTTASGKLAALEQAQLRGAAHTHGGFRSYTLNGFAKGVLVSAGTLAVGYGLDHVAGSAFGYKPTTDGTTRFLLDGVAVPSILLSGMQPRYKIPFAASVFLASRVGDWWYGSGGSVETSNFLRPNAIDAWGITGAALAPIPGKYRAIGMAGAWGLARGWNLLSKATGLQGEQAIDIRENVRHLHNTDLLTNTEGSFLRVAERSQRLGGENPAMLELELVDTINRRSAHPVDYHRSVSSLAYGLGSSRLDLGSRLNPADSDMRNRFLAGTNFDMGGDATVELRRAAGSLVSMQNYVRGHRGEKLGNGQELNDAYLAQLEKLQKEVEKKLDLVYGEQTSFESRIYDQVRARCRTNIQEMTQFIVSYQNFLRTLNTSDKRYVAKINFDLALANIAYADFCASAANGEDAARFFNAGQQYLIEAERLEANAQNVRALKAITDRVRTRVPGAIQAQWNSNINNPNQIRR